MTAWIEGPLGSFIELKRGYDLPTQDRIAGPYPVVSSSGPSGWNNRPKVTAPGVVTGRYGTLGAVFYVEDDFWPLNTTLYVRDFKGNDPRFVSYFLRTFDFTAYSDKAAVPGVNRNALHESRVSFPPLGEQRAVAGVLGALDDRIELNRRMNETLEALARQLHTEAIRGVGLRTLGDLVLINARERSRDFEHGEIEYVDISSVKEGRVDVPSPLRLEEAPSRAQRLVVDGDTIWSCVRPNRRSYAFIDNPPPNRVVSTGFAVLTPQQVPPGFLYLAVTTDDFVDYLSANADGSAYPAVRPEHFERAKIPVPDEDALHSIEVTVRPLLARIAHNERESRTLAELRDALLPKLISGELRVRAAQTVAEEAT
jgi:type I restriction enzyme, S subunit